MYTRRFKTIFLGKQIKRGKRLTMNKQVKALLLTTMITTLSVPSIAIAATSADANATAAPTNASTVASTTGAAVTTGSGITTGTAITNTTTDAAISTGAAVTMPAIIVKDMTFTTPAVKVSLQDAYTKLQSSKTMEYIAIQKKMDEAVAKGYLESVKDLRELDRSNSDAYDSLTDKQAKAMRAFASEMIEPNNTARINKLNRDTFEQYYKLKNMETQLSIAESNLAISKTLLSNVQLKYKLGTVSNMEVLTAQMDVKTAEDTCKDAQDGLNNLKMGFNLTMSYDLMQGVALTDEVKEIAIPKVTLETAIKSALANRNEIKESAYGVAMAEYGLDQYKYYPRTSSKYLSASAALLSAQTNNQNEPGVIEMDVRTKYLSMMNAYQKVQSGKQEVSNAKETARLAQLQYDSGVTTLPTVQQANLGYYKAQLEQANALLDYNLAVEDYNLAQGVGVEAASLSGK